jgi:copper resistance protein D
VAQLLGIFGFLGVLLRGLALALESLIAGGVIFRLVALRDAPAEILARCRRLIAASCAAFVVVQLAQMFMGAAILSGTTDLSFAEAAGASFFAFDLAAAVSAGAVLWLEMRNKPFAAVLPAALILAASVATSHAAARVHDRAPLVILTALHQGATAAWAGGLPYLLLAIGSRKSSEVLRPIAQRFSRIAQTSVAILIAAGLALSYFYIGSIPAVYGTAYGLMVAAKATLLCLALTLGALNRSLARGGSPDALFKMARFSEAEIGIVFTAILAAASVTSQAPAVDVTTERASGSELIARMTPRWPRMQTPPLSSLTPATAYDFRGANELTSYTPGVNYRPPTRGDIEWSEYNHNWAGLIVLSIGILAVLARSGFARWARHWPLAFIGLAVFLLLRADPENWPLGPNGFWESFAAADVAQHRLFVILILAFAAFEWGVRNGRLKSRAAAWVFPAVCAVGGALLLTHSHPVGNLKEQTLIEISHIALAILAVAAGWSRWLEIRLPGVYPNVTSRIWPACFVMIGTVLMLYRES